MLGHLGHLGTLEHVPYIPTYSGGLYRDYKDLVSTCPKVSQGVDVYQNGFSRKVNARL